MNEYIKVENKFEKKSDKMQIVVTEDGNIYSTVIPDDIKNEFGKEIHFQHCDGLCEIEKELDKSYPLSDKIKNVQIDEVGFNHSRILASEGNLLISLSKVSNIIYAPNRITKAQQDFLQNQFFMKEWPDIFTGLIMLENGEMHNMIKEKNGKKCFQDFSSEEMQEFLSEYYENKRKPNKK